jgi:hypothetical protein
MSHGLTDKPTTAKVRLSKVENRSTESQKKEKTGTI